MKDKNYDSIILSMKIDDLISIPADDYIGYFWLDKDGNYTRDEKKLIKKEEIKIPQIRYAESTDDYDYILKREAEKKKQSVDDYVEILLEDIKEMMHQNKEEFKGLNVDLTDKRIRVKKFIAHLENVHLQKINKPDTVSFDTTIFKNYLGAKIYERWETNNKGEIRQQMNFSYVYWALKKSYLNFNITQTNFRDWLIDRGIDINEIYAEMKSYSKERKDKFKDIEELVKQSSDKKN